jgi:hypothetical protein
MLLHKFAYRKTSDPGNAGNPDESFMMFVFHSSVVFCSYLFGDVYDGMLLHKFAYGKISDPDNAGNPDESDVCFPILSRVLFVFVFCSCLFGVVYCLL